MMEDLAEFLAIIGVGVIIGMLFDHALILSKMSSIQEKKPEEKEPEKDKKRISEIDITVREKHRWTFGNDGWYLIVDSFGLPYWTKDFDHFLGLVVSKTYHLTTFYDKDGTFLIVDFREIIPMPHEDPCITQPDEKK